MSRREYQARFRCADGGCQETVSYVCETRAEQGSAYKRNAERPWKCSRHANPDAFLRPGNERTEQVLVATRLPSRLRDGEWLPGLYWCPEGGSQHGSGHQSGPGFIAYTSEFPEGTRLIVTAQIELPAEGEQ